MNIPKANIDGTQIATNTPLSFETKNHRYTENRNENPVEIKIGALLDKNSFMLFSSFVICCFHYLAVYEILTSKSTNKIVIVTYYMSGTYPLAAQSRSLTGLIA